MALLPADVPRDAVIVTRNLQREYIMGTERVRALQGVDMTIRRNEFVAIMGPSGSGKSTMMNLIGCLDTPSEGEYWLNGHGCQRAGRRRPGPDPEQGDRLRLPDLQPAAAGLGAGQRRAARWSMPAHRPRGAGERARAALTGVGLGDRMDHRPNELSGGQRQRVAIARALVNEPSILLADEPTGNLDSATSEEIMGLFRKLHAEGQTIILVTHEPDIAAHAHRQIVLKDGKVARDSVPTEVVP